LRNLLMRVASHKQQAQRELPCQGGRPNTRTPTPWMSLPGHMGEHHFGCSEVGCSEVGCSEPGCSAFFFCASVSSAVGCSPVMCSPAGCSELGGFPAGASLLSGVQPAITSESTPAARAAGTAFTSTFPVPFMIFPFHQPVNHFRWDSRGRGCRLSPDIFLLNRQEGPRMAFPAKLYPQPGHAMIPVHQRITRALEQNLGLSTT
jgi:hypothetical protein